jgi:hypothetical protein
MGIAAELSQGFVVSTGGRKILNSLLLLFPLIGEAFTPLPERHNIGVEFLGHLITNNTLTPPHSKSSKMFHR